MGLTSLTDAGKRYSPRTADSADFTARNVGAVEASAQGKLADLVARHKPRPDEVLDRCQVGQY